MLQTASFPPRLTGAVYRDFLQTLNGVRSNQHETDGRSSSTDRLSHTKGRIIWLNIVEKNTTVTIIYFTTTKQINVTPSLHFNSFKDVPLSSAPYVTANCWFRMRYFEGCTKMRLYAF